MGRLVQELRTGGGHRGDFDTPKWDAFGDPREIQEVRGDLGFAQRF